MRWSAWTGGSGTMELGALPFTANGTDPQLGGSSTLIWVLMYQTL